MCNNLRKFRTLDGPARRIAVRAHLAQSLGLVWNKSPFELTHTERTALDEMARAVGWRKSIASSLSLSAAFYVYLSREVKPAAPARKPASVRQSFSYGSRSAA